MSGINFTSTIGQETSALGYALLVGAAMGFYYDLFRIIRRIFRPGYAMMLALDIIFWLTAAVGVFFGSVVVYGGQFRILFVMGALVGWGFYAATIGSLLIAVINVVFKAFGGLFGIIRQRIFSPAFRGALSLFSAINRRVTDFYCKKTKNKVKKGEKDTSKQQISS